MTDFAPNRLAKNLYGVWRLHVLEQHGHPAPWDEMDEAHKQTWVDVARAAHAELFRPEPSVRLEDVVTDAVAMHAAGYDAAPRASSPDLPHDLFERLSGARVELENANRVRPHDYPSAVAIGNLINAVTIILDALEIP